MMVAGSPSTPQPHGHRGCALDRETLGASRSITVRATSSDGSFTEQAFTIAINDVNEFAVGPIADTDNSADSIDEFAVNGTR